MILAAIIAAVLCESVGVTNSVRIESDSRVIDPAKSVFLKVTLTTASGARRPAGVDLRDRAVGFSLAEDFAQEPVLLPDGTSSETVNWKFIPEPAAKEYKIKPFAFGDCLVPPVKFDPPPPREAVTGRMEIDPERDFPPLSWKLAGFAALALALAALVVAFAVALVRYVARRVKEHRMSPIERAWAELERLIGKGLPGRGRYKDFYVELTMIVRRYIQRRYGIKAPHMTTEEFLRAAKPSDELREFLESADMIKFAGVEATPETADGATESARRYLETDSSIASRKGSPS